MDELKRQWERLGVEIDRVSRSLRRISGVATPEEEETGAKSEVESEDSSAAGVETEEDNDGSEGETEGTEHGEDEKSS